MRYGENNALLTMNELRLIDANQLKEDINRNYIISDTINQAIDNAPTITPESLVSHGRWIVKEETSISPRGRTIHSRLHVCSQCGWSNGRAGHPYCRYCGTKMDLDEFGNISDSLELLAGTCVCCGAPVPEGRMVCWICEREAKEDD